MGFLFGGSSQTAQPSGASALPQRVATSPQLASRPQAPIGPPAAVPAADARTIENSLNVQPLSTDFIHPDTSPPVSQSFINKQLDLQGAAYSMGTAPRASAEQHDYSLIP